MELFSDATNSSTGSGQATPIVEISFHYGARKLGKKGCTKRRPFFVLDNMRKKYEQLFSRLASPEPPAGLLNRIILSIKQEQELRQTKKIMLGFVLLLLTSLGATSFSWLMLVNQVKNSGISYFIAAGVSDFGTFLSLWQNFSLAILELLPITGLAAFIISAGIILFTIRLFVYKKQLLSGYLKQSFS